MIRLRPTHWALAVLVAIGIHLLVLAGMPGRPTAAETGDGARAITIDLGLAQADATAPSPDPSPVAGTTPMPRSARAGADGGKATATAQTPGPIPAGQAESPAEAESEVITEAEAQKQNAQARAQAQKPESIPESATAREPASESIPRSRAQSSTTDRPTGPVGESASQEAAERQSVRYLGELRRWLADHRRYPRRAQIRRLEGIARLEIELTADGQPRASRIIESSGHRLLDQAVREMIERARPFPSPPPELDVAGRVVTVPVAFSLQ